MRTQAIEKRRALRNAIVNSASPEAPIGVMQHVFLSLVERLSVQHMGILVAVAKLAKRSGFLSNWDTPDNVRLTDYCLRAVPDLSNMALEVVVADLAQMRLIDKDYAFTLDNNIKNLDEARRGLGSAGMALVITTSDLYQWPTATQLGMALLRFIQDHDTTGAEGETYVVDQANSPKPGDGRF